MTPEGFGEPQGGAPIRQDTAAPGGRTRVFLVDDHQFFLSGLRAELGAEFEIVGDAGDVDAALEGIRRTRPEVVLLDVHLPGGAAGRCWRRSGPPSRTCASWHCRCRTRPRT